MRNTLSPRLSAWLVVLMMLPALGAGPRPNIVLVMSDDMGYSDIGCYGSEIATPNLDRLAGGGVRFTQFYNTGRCCPTRASLLTGLYPHQAGVGHMMEDRGLEGYRGNLNDRCVTIAEALKPAGYRAYMAGKWHVTRHDFGVTDEREKFNWPRQRGFDRFYGTITGAGNFFDPAALVRDNAYITPLNDPLYMPEGTYYYTDAISDNAVMFINDHSAEHAGAPFFLYVAYTAAHWPMHALPEDIARYQGRYDEGYEPIRAARFRRLRELGLIDPSWAMTPRDDSRDKANKEWTWAWETRNMEVYAAMIDRMDRGIGRIVSALEARGQLDNTLILYLQDNGACAEELGRWTPKEPYRTDYKPLGPDGLQARVTPPMQLRDGRTVRSGPEILAGPAESFIAYGQSWANVSNTPFRLYKHYVHEGGIATPLIAHWPRGIDTERLGRLVSDPAHLVDIMATCVDIAGAAYPAEHKGHAITPMQGLSLAGALNGDPLRRVRPIFWEHEGNRAVRDGRWKLVAKGPRGKWELYDMEADRTELHDLAGRHAEIAAEMAAQWEAWAIEAHAKPWPWKPQ